MARAMVGLYCGSFRQVPRRIVLDVDDTFDAVHGGQQLRLFNAHYDEYGFQPIVVFDGEGRPVAAPVKGGENVYRRGGQKVYRMAGACTLRRPAASAGQAVAVAASGSPCRLRRLAFRR
jgi:hypothetical protein